MVRLISWTNIIPSLPPKPLLKRSLRAMSLSFGFELSISPKTSLLNSHFFSCNGEIRNSELKFPSKVTSSRGRRSSRNKCPEPRTMPLYLRTRYSNSCCSKPLASSMGTAQVEAQNEVEVAEGWSMTQFCDKMIDVFMNEKPQTKEWRKLLVFREDWNKYRENFYNRCRSRADSENDPAMKQKLTALERKVRKIDNEMEKHAELLKEIEKSPTDVNAIVARRRRDFTGEFFRHLTLLSEIYESLEDRDAIARLGARCLSAVSAYDNTVENADTLDAAQAKFDDILNSPSLDVACEKIKSLAKAKDLDSSLILLINTAWAAAKESTTMKNEVKDIMYHIYKTTKSSLRSIAPKEIKLLKYLLNIVDPEERFSALATAFSPADDHAAKDLNALHTTPKELHKWVKIMLDAYHLNKEDTDIREARQMSDPVVIQRLFILKETIEEEYLKKSSETEEDSESNEL